MKKLLLYITILFYGSTTTAQCYTTFIGHASKYYALKTDGTLWIKGFNQYDYFGLGNTNTIPDFIQFGTASDWTLNIAQGETFTLAIKNNGTLWSWGRAIGGPGGGTVNQDNQAPYTQPTQLGTATDWAKVVTSGAHTLAIKTNGTLWVWGTNVDGNCGIPAIATGTVSYTPLQVGTDTDWKEVYASKSCTSFSCGIKTNGTIWTWGNNGIRIGYPNAAVNNSFRSPHQVGTATWKKAAIGGSNGLASMLFGIKTDGTLWGWGATGALTGTYYFGNGQATYSSEVPEQIGTATDWEKIVTQFTTIGLKTNGTLWGWGKNFAYQLGLGAGNNSDMLFPTQMGTDNDWQTIHIDTYEGEGGQLLGIKNDTSIYYSGHYFPSATYYYVPTLFSANACTLSVAENNQSLFLAYPNPFTDTITFEFKEEGNHFELILVNQLGQELEKIKINTVTYTLNTSNLSNGMYYAILKTDGKQTTLKICKH